eukprot:3340441-Rhodomonas_salina.1
MAQKWEFGRGSCPNQRSASQEFLAVFQYLSPFSVEQTSSLFVRLQLRLVTWNMDGWEPALNLQDVVGRYSKKAVTAVAMTRDTNKGDSIPENTLEITDSTFRVKPEELTVDMDYDSMTIKYDGA